MLQRFKRFYKTQQFDPNLLWGALFNPYLIVRKCLSSHLKVIAKNIKGGLLIDIGCGSKPYEFIFDVDSYLGIDLEISGHSHVSSKVDCFYDGKTIPFPTSHFDFALSSEVFEHVFNLDQLLQEIWRVLKFDGLLVITCPFVWAEHEVPFDFGRYTSFGIRDLLERNGFKVLSLEKSNGLISTIAQLTSAYIYQNILPTNKYARMILTPIVIAPVNLIGLLLEKILPKNQALYCNNIAVAQKSVI
jgi:SAM-dependent methyltransferase